MKLTKSKLKQIIKEEFNKRLDVGKTGVLTGPQADQRDEWRLDFSIANYKKEFPQAQLENREDLLAFIDWVRVARESPDLANWYEDNLNKYYQPSPGEEVAAELGLDTKVAGIAERKLTKSKLKRIVKEELGKLLKEYDMQKDLDAARPGAAAQSKLDAKYVSVAQGLLASGKLTDHLPDELQDAETLAQVLKAPAAMAVVNAADGGKYGFMGAGFTDTQLERLQQEIELAVGWPVDQAVENILHRTRFELFLRGEEP